MAARPRVAFAPQRLHVSDPCPATPARPDVLVIGPGAVGSFLGGMLARAGREVVLLGRRAVPGEPSLRLEDRAGVRAVPVSRASDPADVAAPRLVLLAVKAFDLPAALHTASRWPDAVLMTVQNGVGAEEAALAARDGVLLAGSLTAAVEPVPGGVRRLRAGGMGVAVVRGGVEAARTADRLVADWTGAGLPARRFADWAAMKWSKLVANLVGNATSALLDLDPAAIYGDPATFEIERRQLREAVAVMEALRLRPVSIPGANVGLLLRGIALPPPIARPIIARVIGGARGGKAPSLRLHLRDGGTGPTEVRWLNGAVADHGARLGVATPVNALLAALVDEAAADPARAAWWRGRPDRLRAAVDAAVAAAETASPRPPGVG